MKAAFLIVTSADAAVLETCCQDFLISATASTASMGVISV
jgi:hypothetical protein